MINSSAKGKRGERGWRDKLREHGFQAERGQQYHGGPDSPDVRCEELPIHWEVKHTQRLRLSEAYAQAQLEAKDDEIPVLAHRTNRSEWLVTLSADDFLIIIQRSDLINEPDPIGRTQPATGEPVRLPQRTEPDDG